MHSHDPSDFFYAFEKKNTTLPRSVLGYFLVGENLYDMILSYQSIHSFDDTSDYCSVSIQSSIIRFVLRHSITVVMYLWNNVLFRTVVK